MHPELPSTFSKWLHGVSTAYRSLFAHEEFSSLRKHILRGEERTARLAKALTTVAKEIRTYAISANSSMRSSTENLLHECNAILAETKYLENISTISARIIHDSESGRSMVERVDKITDSLVSTMEKALSFLQDATFVMGPMEASRARRVIAHADSLLALDRAQKPHGSYLSSKGSRSMKAAHFIRRLAVASGPLPLVMVFDRHLNSKSPKHLPREKPLAKLVAPVEKSVGT